MADMVEKNLIPKRQLAINFYRLRHFEPSKRWSLLTILGDIGGPYD
jgi:hypothetical protein